MAENDKFNNAKKLEDGDLDKVSGGGLFSTYDEQEYRDAGLEFKWGALWNGTYTLRTSGEELSWNEADNAVVFKKYNHRIANSKAEIKYWWENVYRVNKAKDSSWNDSSQWN